MSAGGSNVDFCHGEMSTNLLRYSLPMQCLCAERLHVNYRHKRALVQFVRTAMYVQMLCCSFAC